MINEKELLLELQKGIPLEQRPFKTIAEKLDLSEADILGYIKDLFDSGKARRFGGIFDSNKLGFDSTLCAVNMPEDKLTNAIEILAAHSGVTHLYEREANPNIWFTLTAPAENFEQELNNFSEKLAPLEIFSLPVVKKFKIQVVFDTTGKEKNLQAHDARKYKNENKLPLNEFSKADKTVLQGLQGNIALSEQPFDGLASDTGYSVDELLTLLKQWKEIGVLRRIGIVLRHRKIGFTANGMCTWKVDADKIENAGEAVASFPEVTHCYERIVAPVFPYNLFAMVHADSKEKAESIMHSIESKAGLTGGRILFSTKEFKKSSMIFVPEN